MKMSVEYRTGFLEIKGLEFRPDILRKGKELLTAGHIFNVKETHKANNVTITGHCNCQAGIDGQCKHSSGLVSQLFITILNSFRQ
jgi:hypothetical protein